jgi:hypothetical protein
MNKFFEKYLKLAKEKNKLVSIRSSQEGDDKFSVGTILGINDATINIKAINPKGLPDGIFTIQTKDLYGIDINDMYIRKLELRANESKEIYKDMPAPSFFSEDNIDIRRILVKANEVRQLIHLNFYRDMGLYGFIIELNNDEFVIEVYTENGNYDGKSVYLIDDIKNINWDDEDNRIVEKSRKQKKEVIDF